MKSIVSLNNDAIQTIYQANFSRNLSLPLLLSRVPAGFPSPANDYMDKSLDLNEYLIQHPSSTYYIRVSGDSMTGAGIYSGDILIVDKSLQPRSGTIIIASIYGELTVKRFIKKGPYIYLAPENPAYETIEVTEGMDFEVRGVVIHVIHSYI